MATLLRTLIIKVLLIMMAKTITLPKKWTALMIFRAIIWESIPTSQALVASGLNSKKWPQEPSMGKETFQQLSRITKCQR